MLLADIRKMSEDPGLYAKKPDADFSRKRKMDFESLLRFLVSMQSGATGHELLKFFNYGLDTPSISAFCQQRKKLLPSALPHLMHQFNSHFPVSLYDGKYSLLGCDGCEFNIARNPDDPDSFYPPSRASERGYNLLHITSLFDILGKRYLDCIIQPGMNKNEFRAICDLADRYPFDGNPVFIADRGFASYNFFAHAIENSIFFLVRAKDLNTLRFLNLQALPIQIDTHVDLVLTRTQSKKKWLRPDLREHYRYISKEVSFDFIQHGSFVEYPLHLRVVRFAVAEGVYENMITNLPDDVSSDVIKHWYHLRWDIETSFRDLKHTIGTINFHLKKLEYIVQEIWARLILFNFCAVITSHVVISQKNNKHAYQVNFAMSMKICHHFIRCRSGEPPPDMEALIGSFTLPIRSGRTFVRKHRPQLPASFCYRFS